MRQTDKRKEKDKITIVLFLSFCVIALTSIFTIKANVDKINHNSPDLPVVEEAKSGDNEETKAQDSLPDQESIDAASKIPTVDSLESITFEFISPLKDTNITITNAFSMDQLIYSKTLDQYMTHRGVDIEAPENSEVCAIASGTVTAVYNDDRFGSSIEITHKKGLISIYSNLSEDTLVETGDTVTQGHVIGYVGKTSLFEASEPAHLHFEIIKDGTNLNPEDYVEF